MSELGEGDCAIQCWICPKCHDDHSQNNKCKTIDLWDVYSNLTHYRDQMEQDKPELNRRIRKLIDLVRKKDEALKKMTRLPTHLPDIFQINPIAEEAIALTEELK